MKLKIILSLLLASSLLFPSPAANAQATAKIISHQQQYWLRVYEKIGLGNGLTFHIELEDRRYASPDRQYQWLLPALHLHKDLGNGWEAAIGFSYYSTSLPQDGTKAITIVQPELRPFQEFDYKQSIGKLLISHRYRLEERYIRKTTATGLAPGYNFNFRARYQLQLDYPIITGKTGNNSLHIRVYDEPMLNFGSSIVRNTFDQNRLYGALNYRVNKSFQLEAGYLYYFQEKSDGDHYVSRDILRVTLYHALNFR